MMLPLLHHGMLLVGAAVHRARPDRDPQRRLALWRDAPHSRAARRCPDAAHRPRGAARTPLGQRVASSRWRSGLAQYLADERHRDAPLRRQCGDVQRIEHAAEARRCRAACAAAGSAPSPPAVPGRARRRARAAPPAARRRPSGRIWKTALPPKREPMSASDHDMADGAGAAATTSRAPRSSASRNSENSARSKAAIADHGIEVVEAQHTEAAPARAGHPHPPPQARRATGIRRCAPCAGAARTDSLQQVRAAHAARPPDPRDARQRPRARILEMQHGLEVRARQERLESRAVAQPHAERQLLHDRPPAALSRAAPAWTRRGRRTRA